MYGFDKICHFFGINLNPYLRWDNTVNPKWLIYRRFGKGVVSFSLDDTHSLEAFNFLKKNAVLIEEHIEESKDKDSEEYSDLVLFEVPCGGKYWYKDNIVEASVNEENKVSLTFYASSHEALCHKDFEKWVIKTEGKSHVSILISRNGNLAINNVDFDAPKIDDLELNYGSGFTKAHNKIVNRLSEKRAGLVIFHGVPGSGKSTYIKYLSSIVDREFIFVPVNMTSELASPSFITALMNHKDAIIILEDAEQAVKERGNGGDDSIVSTLLNMSDGILGNILRITLIVSWNMDRQHVDKALLRKGRLLFEHDFSELKVEDAQRLAKHLGKDIEVKHPMTLADIYGVEIGETFVPRPPKEMGFHTLVSGTPKESDIKKKSHKQEKS